MWWVKREILVIIISGDGWTGPLSTVVSDDRESPREDGVGRWYTWTAWCWPHPSWNPPPLPPLTGTPRAHAFQADTFFHFSQLSLSHSFFSFLFFFFSIKKKKKKVKRDNQYSFLFGAYCSSTLFVLGWNSIFSVCEKFIYYFLNYLR